MANPSAARRLWGRKFNRHAQNGQGVSQAQPAEPRFCIVTGPPKPSSREVDLREITDIDPVLLEQIGRLRVVAWATVIEKATDLGSWVDAFDPKARHWVVYQGAELVAAARMTIHPSLDEVPDAESYSGMFQEPLPPPIASLNRLVVHPSARRMGLSKALDVARLEAAERLGCHSAILSTASGPNRVRQVQGWGFEWIGYGPRFLNPPLCHLPPPAVLVCRLPRQTECPKIR